MSLDRRLLLACLAPGAALALWLALGGALGWLVLAPAERAALAAAGGPLVETYGMLAVLWWLVAAALGAVLAARFHEGSIAAARRLADATRTLAGDAAAPDLPLEGAAPVRAVAAAVNALAGQRRALQQDMARLVEEASRSVAQQRDQLAALMAELQQSVVVCNLDGRILLYNGRARALFRRLAPPGKGAGKGVGKGASGAELIGLGRSIHGVIDKALIAHAREVVERRIAGGDAAASAHFVTTTPAGHLLRVSMAPVRAAGPEGPQGRVLSGFVLLLDDITDEYRAQSRRDRRLLELIEASRASFANMQAALDMLDYPDLDAAERERFQAVVRDEVEVMTGRLGTLATDASEDLKVRWPLQDMLGADLLSAAARRIVAETGVTPALGEVDGALWLSVDSFALIAALAFLAGRVIEVADATAIALRLAPADGRAHLDLVWHGGEVAAEVLAQWQNGPMRGAEAGSPLSVRDVAERHGGEVWVKRERDRAFFRFLLPTASMAAAESLSAGESRPEYYDFDLFAAAEVSRDLDARALAEITYTVFDTETTGLDPAGGDEILQIGATRIVNGKMLRGECFDQLVDPERSIPEAGIAVHGIRPEMVRGQPVIAEALPAFHAFAADTVLVGHNVAFDLRFLKLKEAASGVVFDQPVLDTLLLASVVYPNEASHGLEAVAARLGVVVSGRHTALGDALATAEVFLKLVPLLRQRGILTLGQAREASQASYYARLRY